MTNQSVLSVWIDGAPIDRKHVGGKGASLARLVALGAPVPLAFCITTNAYRLVSKIIGLPMRASEIRDDELPALRAAIEAACLPDEILEQLHTSFAALDDRSIGPLSAAVRSSSTAEDSANFSFAGLHETVLGVNHLTSLETAVKRCWASLWTERAVTYRRQSGLATDEATIAVVVQELVKSDISVVVFTTDPVSGCSNRLVINATWGLGESLVSGLVTPDQIVVDERDEVIEYVVGAKAMMIVPRADGLGGTREVAVPRLLREKRTLSDNQISSIAAIARGLANKLGYAADIEGGIRGDQFYLFQARPITTLDRSSASTLHLVA